MKNTIAALLLFSLLSCNKKQDNNPAVSTDNLKRSNERNDARHDALSTEVVLKKTNDELLQALKVGYYDMFANYIHPEKGVRFSMYAYISIKEDKHFSKSDFIKYYPTNTVFTWGSRDGSGDLYKATIDQYIKKWVFVRDFTKSQYSMNTFQGRGNTLNNLPEIYPNTDFTENFIKGTEENSEIDWNSLRFVFEKYEGKYYLIAVVNDLWTI